MCLFRVLVGPGVSTLTNSRAPVALQQAWVARRQEALQTLPLRWLQADSDTLRRRRAASSSTPTLAAQAFIWSSPMRPTLK